MRRTTLLLVAFVTCTPALCAQDTCITRDNLLELDAGWERALTDSDVDFLARLMADEFVWVHNHASSVDTKESLLERARAGDATGKPRAREQSDITVHLTGPVGVVYGTTTVIRDSTSPTYTFMRTYADIDGRCLLVANQTMRIDE